MADHREPATPARWGRIAWTVLQGLGRVSLADMAQGLRERP